MEPIREATADRVDEFRSYRGSYVVRIIRKKKKHAEKARQEKPDWRTRAGQRDATPIFHQLARSRSRKPDNLHFGIPIVLRAPRWRIILSAHCVTTPSSSGPIPLDLRIGWRSRHVLFRRDIRQWIRKTESLSRWRTTHCHHDLWTRPRESRERFLVRSFMNFYVGGLTWLSMFSRLFTKLFVIKH